MTCRPATEERRRYEAFAVSVPEMSVPQNGVEETGVKPLLPACMIQVH